MMFKSFKTIVVATILFSLSTNAYSDSPITSTFFYTSYMDYEMVNYAYIMGTVDEKIATYMLDDKNLIDVKAAIVNAVSWSYDGKANAEILLPYILIKYQLKTSEDLSRLNGADLMTLGYLKAMDQYFNVVESEQLLLQAKTKMPESYTVHLMWALVKSQSDMEFDFCKVWTNTREVILNTHLNRDIKTSAIQQIVDYMLIYKSYCQQE